ncbi:heavy metal translocating P-type ATPase metal-binding domain-containing protein [Verrucomicrobiaceae bacterium R5-34]|nr:heavy metal translocating P-type ATPase metal-binding domain-containing protein [Verrucomicrobiaceae bacterium R5-34]
MTTTHSTVKECIHCNTPLEKSQEESGFCCTGCEFVYGLIHEEGLESFYDLKQEERLSPLNDQPFQEYDFSWLSDEVEQREQDVSAGDRCEIELSLQGISCVGCVWLVEKLFLRQAGSLSCDISPATGAMHVAWKAAEFDMLSFAHELQKFGYIIGRPRDGKRQHDELRKLGNKLGICGAFALNAMGFSLPRYLGMPADFMFAGIFELIAMLSATLAMLVGGSWFIQRAVQSLRAGVLHMDTPIALGVSLAFLGSLAGWLWKHEGLLYFDFVAIFIFLMLGGRWLQTAAVERNRNRLLEQTPVPRSLTRVPEGDAIDLADLQSGDRYALPAGQTTPVASILAEGEADFSLEWINGEPEPCHHQTGTHVPAGAIKLSQASIVLRAEENWTDSLLAQLLREGDSSAQSPVLAKILKVYLSVVLVLGFGGGLAWLLTGADLPTALQVTISVFVISCPCALGVALPLADDMASSAMRTLGVFIRKPAFWSRIRRIRSIFFDKTGTLTQDLPALSNVSDLKELNETSSGMLASLCAKSRHPLSRSLLRSLGLRGQKLIDPKLETHEVPGLGTWLIGPDGNRWSLGKCSWSGMDESQVTAPHAGCELRCNGSPIATFTFEESLRPETAETLAALGTKQIYILSGDQNQRVQTISKVLGVPEPHVHAGLSPDDKARMVRETDPDHSLFLGDGANDSLAFDAAAMSGAVAGRGLLEAKSDFYFLSSGLKFLPNMFQLADRHALAVRAVFTFSLIYNLCAVALCLAGHMNPLLAAILMPLSSIVSLTLVAGFLAKNKRFANLDPTNVAIVS